MGFGCEGGLVVIEIEKEGFLKVCKYLGESLFCGEMVGDMRDNSLLSVLRIWERERI